MRCKNEEEYIVASILSIYRIFDEIVVVLNNSADRTRELIEDLLPDHPKIRLLEYANAFSQSQKPAWQNITTGVSNKRALAMFVNGTAT
jgi:glycosyltransferase involved in cell wall biosynthesis